MFLPARIPARPLQRVLAATAVALVALGSLNASGVRRPASQPPTGLASPGPASAGSASNGPARDTRVGELPERRTATSATRRNADGSYTTSVSSMPMNYQTSDGSWHGIDTALHANSGAYAWASGANSYQMRFKSAAGPGFAEFQVGEQTLRLSAQGARDGGPARVHGGQITYPGAYPETDLRYQMGATGVRKVLDLSGPDAPASYTFRLSTSESKAVLSARARPDGSYALSVGNGLVLDAPVVWEGDDPAPVPAARPSLKVARQGDDLLVTVSLDEAWLHAAGRRFPVHLDPTITVQPDLRRAVFTTSGGGPVSITDLMVGSDTTRTYRSTLQFDLSAVPAGAQVSSANLGIYFGGCLFNGSPSKPCSNDHVLDVHRLTAAWTESSTFSQIAFDSTVLASATVLGSSPAGWKTWPVSGLVSAWVNGTQPNYGVLVKRHTETLGSNGPVGRAGNGGDPKIDITYTVSGPYLQTPSTLHANGAELTWTPSATGSGSAGFEVYRAAGSASFTPSPTTLVASVGDRSETTYRDTTAAAGGTFTYRVKDLADGTVSVPRTVTLPAAGLATMVLQPAAADGRMTELQQSVFGTYVNYGSKDTASVGTVESGDFTDVYRTLVAFDVRNIPPSSTITSASLSMWHRYGPTPGMVVEAHRMTRPWLEGTQNGGSDWANGAYWYESQPGQSWTSQGGDDDAAAAASTTIGSVAAGWDQFSITSLVQSWVNGNAPNDGLLLKLANEFANAGFVTYASDDFGIPGLRPTLTVSYQDGSAAQAAQVSLSAPGPNAKVSGQVPLSAAAQDDRRVDLVEFLVNGASVGSDSVAPFQVTWNSAATSNGAKAVTVRATDDAGNVSTSAPVNVTVDNTAPPTGMVSGPAAGATVGGDVTVSATASDDVGVASVAFLVDGVQVGAPVTAAPWQATWKTLDPLAGTPNGAHQLTAVVTDTSGQQVVTAAESVTVNNLASTAYSASFALNNPTDPTDDVFPQAMTENTNAGVPVQDPYAGTTNPDGTSGGSLGRSLSSAPHDDAGAAPPSCPGGAYCPSVTVTNTSGATWSGSTAQVWYRWYAPNGAVMFEGKSAAAFPATFANNATQAFPLTIYPPALPPGVAEGSFRLRIDIFDPATGTWFAAKGNGAVDNPVLITKALATKLGLERFYQYDGDSTGAGAADLVNIANGDLIERWSPFFDPGRGLATMTDLTYNSLEDHSTSPAGNNFSLSMSGLIRLGEPLDIHPNKADQISGQANKFVEFTDGDGSTHHFTGTTGTDGITRWTEPAGVNLYLRSLSGTDPARQWALTRPDKVTFYFDADGFPTSVEDRNGNKITYTLEDTPPGEDPGGPKKRVTAVTDAGGRSFTLDYWSKAEAKKAHIRGKIQRITDHSGHALDFDYYEDGNLLRLTQRGGTKADGTFLADRSFVFTYTTSNGAGPAIPSASARVNPEPRTPNESTRLYSVRDPRGSETTYAYYQATDGSQLRWKLKSRTDRAGQTTSYVYDLTNRITTVNKPLSRSTRFGYDTTGKVTSITNAKNETTGVQWTADFKVSQVTEPTGKFSSYTYNANGYLLSKTNQAGEKTEVTYLDQAVDANDTAKHLSLIATLTNPKGVATPAVPDDYQWKYTYDSAGNIDKVTDPTNAVTDYDYNLAGTANPGTLAAVHDANGDAPTTYPDYDPSGQPTRIVDPLGNTTRLSYDPDGQLRTIQDADHQNDSGADERAYKTIFDYDSFHRLGRQSAPKSTATDRGNLLWSVTDFDANDNIVRQSDPHFGPITGDPGTTSVTTTSFDAMDRQTLITGPDTSADPAGERIRFDYDAAGRLIKLTDPKGVQSSTVDDYATISDYDPLDRVVKRTVTGTSATQTRVTQMCYDVAGDLRSVTAPRAGTATITCPGNGPATAPFTSQTDFDAAHRPVAQRDPLGHEQRTTYDANGNVTRQEKDITTGRVSRTDIDYDQRDAPVVSRELFDGTTGRVATTRVEYDRNGNKSRLISPRASDAGGNGPYTNYVTAYHYDANNRLTTIDLPFDGKDGTERQHEYRAYDPNGNMLWTSLPVTSSSASAVADTARTVMTYFDPGWIRTSDDPNNPKVHYDYTAQGLQAERTPENASGGLDDAKQMTWNYYLDGQLKSRKDQGGQLSTYAYDANNNLTDSTDGAGVTDPTEHAVQTQASYTGFNEVAKVRHRKQGETVWKFTGYTYDDNGNVTQRRENGEEDDAGSQTDAPRTYQLSYDGADWLTQQLDLGTDSACKDDTRTVNAWQGTGWEKQRDTYRADASCTSDPTTWPKKQTTTWTQFDNGKLRQLTTKNGSGQVTESHDVGYFDTGNVYVDGNRTTDRYVLERADGNTAQTCRAASPCDSQYEYDARDRLIREQPRAGVQNTYTFDEPAKLIGDTTIRAGNITTQSKNGQTTSRRYTGTQLTDSTVGAATAKYWYDPTGNLDCVTTSAGSQSDCSPADGATPANLVADYGYDYLNRLTSTRMFNGTSRTDMSTYTYDALDRTTKETEDHQDPGKDRTTDFTYQGLTNLVTEEKQAGGNNPKTKTYSYDSYGHRIQLTDKNNTTGATDTYTYGTDVHGSISQLITDSGKVKASYGYDAYGGTDSTDSESLTTGDTDTQAPLNPYRYSNKRLDSGTAPSSPQSLPAGAAQYDMGARRFGPDISKFLQQDTFYTALGDLGLALDPLTQNTYSLAGGNPVSYVEFDGHMLIADGGGGSSPSPNPTKPSGTEGSGGQDSPDWTDRLVPNWRTAAGAGLDYAGDWLKARGEDAIELGRIRGGLWRLRALTPSDNPLKRLPGISSIRSAYWNSRAALTEFKGSVVGKTLKTAGRGLGIASAGLAAWEGWDQQKELDANRGDLSNTERNIRAGVRGGLTAGGAIAGGIAGDALCGPLCGVAGAWAGQHVGGWVADRAFDVVDNVDWSPEGSNVGEKAWNLTKDIGGALEDTLNPFD
jgi:YD repeat-containing protein